MKPRILFTGGGTAGHVIPHFPLIEELQQQGWNIDYIGSENGIEKRMITSLNIPYYSVSTGKLRRYFSLKNCLDPLKIILGICQAYYLLCKLNTDIVFSKGGFVSFPVVVAAWLKRIPVVAHESDMSPGLANRLSFPFVNRLCLNFAGAQQYFKKHQAKTIITGTPIRSALFKGSQAAGLAQSGFHSDKPCLLIVGGSQGSQSLNYCIRHNLDLLCQNYQIIHLCGKGNLDSSLSERTDYYQTEYADKNLADLLAASEIVISRAGANTLCEILALRKLHILIPLPRAVSRGDQIQNATYFQQQGISYVIDEADLATDVLLTTLKRIQENKTAIYQKMQSLIFESATIKIIEVLKAQLKLDKATNP